MNEITFEKALQDLEGIIKDLESGTIPLEEAINKYTDAMNLVKICQEKLDKATKQVNKILNENNVDYIFVDFHGEATSEKQAFGWYFDGRVTAVLGTHTHVPTADSRILPRGTGFQCDVGMTGPNDGILGMDRDIVLKRFITGLPARFQVAAGDMQLNGVIIDCNEKGRCTQIKPIHIFHPSV